MPRVVLITGISSGIGASCAQLYKSHKFKVVGIDKNSPKDPMKSVIDHFYQLDLSNSKELEKFINDFTSKYAQLDVLVNNAGVHLFKSAQDTSLDEFDFVYAVNVRAPFLLSKSLFNLLSKSQGAIVNVCSVNAFSTTAYRSVYASSKSALLGLTRALALEFGPKVRVNAVNPGPTHTEMMREHVRQTEAGEDEAKVDDFVAKFGETAMLGRMGTPEDIAKTVYYLGDNKQSAFMTGQSITVDGGCLASYALAL